MKRILPLLLGLIAWPAWAGGLWFVKNQADNDLVFMLNLYDIDATVPCSTFRTDVTNATAGFTIEIQPNGGAGSGEVAYVAGATIQTITAADETIYEAPSASNIRFEIMDDGKTYALHVLDSVLDETGAKDLILTVTDAGATICDDSFHIYQDIIDQAAINARTLAAADYADTTDVATITSAVTTVSDTLGSPVNYGSGATISANLTDTPTRVGALVIEPNGAVTLRCAEAIGLARAAGRWSQTGSVVTFRDPTGVSQRIVGTVSSTSLDGVTITCPP